jgi:hypothetical protein
LASAFVEGIDIAIKSYTLLKVLWPARTRAGYDGHDSQRGAGEYHDHIVAKDFLDENCLIFFSWRVNLALPIMIQWVPE